MAAAPQALLPCEQLCNNAETTAGSVNIPTEPDNTLPHYLVDNLPDCHFDAAVNCKLGDTAIFSAEQYCEAIEKPTKVLIDTRILTPHVFEKAMMAYLSEKTKHPDKQAVIITYNGGDLRSQDHADFSTLLYSWSAHKKMQNMARPSCSPHRCNSII